MFLEQLRPLNHLLPLPLLHRLQPLPHALRQRPEPDARKEVYAEANVFRVLSREHARQVVRQRRLVQRRDEPLEAHVLGEVLEQNLDEDAAAARRVLLRDPHAAQLAQAERARGEHVRKELCNVAQLVGLVAVDGGKVLYEALAELVRPEAVELGEALADQAVELGVGAFLGAAFDDHAAELLLHADGEVDL